MYRQASVLNRSGKNYLCTCLAEFLQSVDKVIKLLRIQKLHLYEHRILSCHTIALYDILHTLNKRIKLFLLYRLQIQIDKGLYLIDKINRIFCGMIALYDTLALPFIAIRAFSCSSSTIFSSIISNAFLVNVPPPNLSFVNVIFPTKKRAQIT